MFQCAWYQFTQNNSERTDTETEFVCFITKKTYSAVQMYRNMIGTTQDTKVHNPGTFETASITSEGNYV